LHSSFLIGIDTPVTEGFAWNAVCVPSLCSRYLVYFAFELFFRFGHDYWDETSTPTCSTNWPMSFCPCKASSETPLGGLIYRFGLLLGIRLTLFFLIHPVIFKVVRPPAVTGSVIRASWFQ